jgi:hypothetical protein
VDVLGKNTKEDGHTVVVSRENKKVFHENYCPYARKIKLENRLFISDFEAERRGYHECKFCRSVKGMAYKYKCKSKKFQTSYDPKADALCIRTDVGFWRVIWSQEEEGWKLFHLNHGDFNSNLETKVLMRRRFHRQWDVVETTNLKKIFDYIRHHDSDYAKYGNDYHKMPTQTSQQKKYRQHAKNRARKKSIRNVYKILDQIQNGR